MKADVRSELQRRLPLQRRSEPRVLNFPLTTAGKAEFDASSKLSWFRVKARELAKIVAVARNGGFWLFQASRLSMAKLKSCAGVCVSFGGRIALSFWERFCGNRWSFD